MQDLNEFAAEDMVGMAAQARVPLADRHVLVGADEDINGAMHDVARWVAGLLGVRAQFIPEAKHNMEAYPAYITAVAAAVITG